MHRRRGLAVTFAVIVTIAMGLLVAPPLFGDGALYYYKEENGTIVFTNVRQGGTLAVPGFASIRAARALPATPHDRYIGYLSDEFGVSADLIKAVAMVESGFDAHARSPKGALGLMQLMPATARRYGVKNPLDPWQNLRGGVAYLSDLLHLYDGDLSLTLAAYNAGPGALRRYGGVPPYLETRNYVRKVLDLLDGRAPTRSRTKRTRRRELPAPARVVRAADGTISLVN